MIHNANGQRLNGLREALSAAAVSAAGISRSQACLKAHRAYQRNIRRVSDMVKEWSPCLGVKT